MPTVSEGLSILDDLSGIGKWFVTGAATDGIGLIVPVLTRLAEHAHPGAEGYRENPLLMVNHVTLDSFETKCTYLKMSLKDATTVHDTVHSFASAYIDLWKLEMENKLGSVTIVPLDRVQALAYEPGRLQSDYPDKRFRVFPDVSPALADPRGAGIPN